MFIKSETFTQLHEEDQSLLKDQHRAMSSYYAIIKKRIMFYERVYGI